MKLNAANMTQTIAGIEGKWKASFPELPFQYTFLDQDFNSQYAADRNGQDLHCLFHIDNTYHLSRVAGTDCLHHTAKTKGNKHTKSHGCKCRAVSSFDDKEFCFVGGLSCLIAFPVAWYFMDKWLKIFPYNTGLSAQPFILSAIVVLLITMMTVIFHTLKAAFANPVKSLRTE
jgi:putative ABC transport system permease protein